MFGLVPEITSKVKKKGMENLSCTYLGINGRVEGKKTKLLRNTLFPNFSYRYLRKMGRKIF